MLLTDIFIITRPANFRPTNMAFSGHMSRLFPYHHAARSLLVHVKAIARTCTSNCFYMYKQTTCHGAATDTMLCPERSPRPKHGRREDAATAETFKEKRFLTVCLPDERIGVEPKSKPTSQENLAKIWYFPFFPLTLRLLS